MPVRLIDQIKSNAVPVELVRTAAKGALPLPAVDMLEILVHLATHSPFAQEAMMTLAGWDLVSAIEVASDPNSPPEILGYFWLEGNRRPALVPHLIENPAIPETLLLEAAAAGRREIINALLSSPRARSSPLVVEALRSNPELTQEQLRELEEQPVPPSPTYTDHDAEAETAFRVWHDAHLAEIAAEEGQPFQLIGEVEELDHEAHAQPSAQAEGLDQPVPPELESSTTLAIAGLGAVAKPKRQPLDEKKLSLLQRIERMNTAERVKTAFSGSRDERLILIRDGAKIVRSAVLASPKLTEPELETFAAAKSLHESVLREIARTRRFLKNYHVVRNLVWNPKCPLDISLTLVKNLLVHDLKGLRFNKEVPDTIRQVAGQLYREKTGPAREIKRH